MARTLTRVGRLGVSLKYLRLSGLGLDFYRWHLPLIAAGALTLLEYQYPSFVTWSGESSVLKSTLGLLQTLSGLYIAALAAIATFGSTVIDQRPDGDVWYGGRQLSRRMYLSYLFGYLTVASFGLYVGGSIGGAYAARLSENVCAKLTAVGLFATFLCQLAVLTLLALTFLIEQLGHKWPPQSGDEDRGPGNNECN